MSTKANVMAHLMNCPQNDRNEHYYKCPYYYGHVLPLKYIGEHVAECPEKNTWVELADLQKWVPSEKQGGPAVTQIQYCRADKWLNPGYRHQAPTEGLKPSINPLLQTDQKHTQQPIKRVSTYWDLQDKQTDQGCSPINWTTEGEKPADVTYEQMVAILKPLEYLTELPAGSTLSLAETMYLHGINKLVLAAFSQLLSKLTNTRLNEYRNRTRYTPGPPESELKTIVDHYVICKERQDGNFWETVLSPSGIPPSILGEIDTLWEQREIFKKEQEGELGNITPPSGQPRTVVEHALSPLPLPEHNLIPLPVPAPEYPQGNIHFKRRQKGTTHQGLPLMNLPLLEKAKYPLASKPSGSSGHGRVEAIRRRLQEASSSTASHGGLRGVLRQSGGLRGVLRQFSRKHRGQGVHPLVRTYVKSPSRPVGRGELLRRAIQEFEQN
jgi:hypothetical protein